jgi:hypothetical protein
MSEQIDALKELLIIAPTIAEAISAPLLDSASIVFRKHGLHTPSPEVEVQTITANGVVYDMVVAPNLAEAQRRLRARMVEDNQAAFDSWFARHYSQTQFPRVISHADIRAQWLDTFGAQITPSALEIRLDASSVLVDLDEPGESVCLLPVGCRRS